MSRTGRFRLLGAGLICATLTLPLVGLARTASDPGGSFSDDDGSIHEADIEAIAAEGITRGCNPPQNDRYCPQDSVTRGQMAAFLKRALSLPSSSEDRFIDDDSSVFELDIQSLAAAKITLGCNPPANTRYCPDDPVTRGQMAAFLSRALSLPAYQGSDRFVDDDESVFEADIEALAQAGITVGCNPPANDRFCPSQPVTRAQMASFLTRALGLTPIQPPPATSSTATTSTTSTTTATPPGGVGQYLCYKELSTWTCSGDVNAEPGIESWDCSVLSNNVECSGNVDTIDSLKESWSCTNSDITVTCSGDIDLIGDGDEKWQCIFIVGAWECDGDINRIDLAAEHWTCSDAGQAIYCTGDIEPLSAGYESWSCYTDGLVWFCEGDHWQIPVTSPIPVLLEFAQE